MAGEPKKPITYRVTLVQAFFMLTVAVLGDAAEYFGVAIAVGAFGLGWIISLAINLFVTSAVVLFLIIFLQLIGFSLRDLLFSKRRLISALITSFLELFPYTTWLPMLTVYTGSFCLIIYLEDIDSPYLRYFQTAEKALSKDATPISNDYNEKKLNERRKPTPISRGAEIKRREEKRREESEIIGGIDTKTNRPPQDAVGEEIRRAA